jgi:hypothetical protein
LEQFERLLQLQAKRSEYARTKSTLLIHPLAIGEGAALFEHDASVGDHCGSFALRFCYSPSEQFGRARLGA